MALYIPHSIFNLARLLYVRPETFGLCCVLLYFPHGRSNWCPPFCSTKFENFELFLIYFPKCPIFSTTQSCAPNVSLVSSLNLSPVCRWKESSSCWMQLLSLQPWIWFNVQTVCQPGKTEAFKITTMNL